jgi:hypothetical protein
VFSRTAPHRGGLLVAYSTDGRKEPNYHIPVHDKVRLFVPPT